MSARLDHRFRIAAWALGAISAAISLIVLLTTATRPIDTSAAVGIMAALVLTAALLAYGFTRAIGMIALALHSALVHGPEITVDLPTMGADLRLRSTWAILLELALLLATAVMMVVSLIAAVRHQSLYSGAVFVLLATMTFWPFLRYRIRAGRWPS